MSISLDEAGNCDHICSLFSSCQVIPGLCMCNDKYEEFFCSHSRFAKILFRHDSSGNDLGSFEQVNTLEEGFDLCRNEPSCVGYSIRRELFGSYKIWLKYKIIYPVLGSTDDMASVAMLDKKLGICGDPFATVQHEPECIDLLWKNVGCKIGTEAYLNNINDWKGVKRSYDIENEMQVFSENSTHYSLPSSWDSRKSVREMCFGELSPSTKNIAIYKIVTSSPVSENELFHPNHIVDGVEMQDPLLGGCALLEGKQPWIYIDLLIPHKIRQVTLIPPSCCCDDQMVDLNLKLKPPSVINSVFYYEICEQNVSLTTGEKLKTILCKPHINPGQYFSVYSNINKHLAICEIKLFTDDLLLNKEAFSSSYHTPSSMAFNAVSEFLTDFYFQSVPSQHQWFGVDMENVYYVYGNWYTVLCENKETFGRFLVLEKRDSESLQLYKISAWGILKSRITEDDYTFKNIAYNKPVKASSMLEDNLEGYVPYAYAATDGILNFFMCHTNNIKGWVQIDLLGEYKVNYIGMLTRRYYAYVYANIRGYLTNVSLTTDQAIPFIIPNCFDNSDGTHISVIAGEMKFWKCKVPEPFARYTVLYNLGTQPVKAHEIQVFGYPLNHSSIFKRLEFMSANSNHMGSAKKYKTISNILPVKAIDKKLPPAFQKFMASCTSARETGMPSRITVFLNATHIIDEIIVLPCFDLHDEILENIESYVEYSRNFKYQKCDIIVGDNSTLLIPTYFQCPPKTEGDRISVYRNDSKSLSISEIIAFGVPSAKNLEAANEQESWRFLKEGYKLQSTITYRTIQESLSILDCWKECNKENCKAFSYSKLLSECIVSKEKLMKGFTMGKIEPSNQEFATFILTGLACSACQSDDDCIANGYCQEGNCHCNTLYKGSLCNEGRSIKIYDNYVSEDYPLTQEPFIISTYSACYDACLNNTKCVGFVSMFYTSQFHCSMQEIISYPMIYRSPKASKNYTTMILKNSEYGVCGLGNITARHSEECIEYLWEKTGCVKNSFYFLAKLSFWITNLKIDNIKYEMKFIRKNSVHISYSQAFNEQNEWYRVMCFDHISPSIFNIALYKTVVVYTSNETENSELYHYSHIVDGVTESNPLLGGCSKATFWIGVDLLQDYFIITVAIYAPTCCSTQIVDITINKNHIQNITKRQENLCMENVLLNSSSSKTMVNCLLTVSSGRYVILSNALTTSMITICEIEVFTSNILYKQQQVYSSGVSKTYFSPNYALKERVSTGYCFVASYSSTSYGWITIDLQNIYLIYGIDILSLINTSHHIDIILSNNNKTSEGNFENGIICGNETNFIADYYSTFFCNINNSTGKYISIIKKELGKLSICQLEMWGLLIGENNESAVNIAYNKPVWQSSLKQNSLIYAPYFATDGSSGIYFAKTLKIKYSWLLVDLLSQYKVLCMSILIHPRETYLGLYNNIHGHITRKLLYIPLNSSLLLASMVGNCFETNSTESESLIRGKLKFWYCKNPNPIGRFSLLYTSLDQSLTIPELEIYGTPEFDAYSVINTRTAFMNSIDTISTDYPNYKKYGVKAVDGFTCPITNNVIIPGSSCAMGVDVKEIKLTVILSKVYLIKEIVVILPMNKLRSDSFNNVFISADQTADLITRKLCNFYKKNYEKNVTSLPIYIHCLGELYGDQVSFYRSDGFNRLEICEIFVLGRKANFPAENLVDRFVNVWRMVEKGARIAELLVSNIKLKTKSITECSKFCSKTFSGVCLTNDDCSEGFCIDGTCTSCEKNTLFASICNFRNTLKILSRVSANGDDTDLEISDIPYRANVIEECINLCLERDDCMGFNIFSNIDFIHCYFKKKIIQPLSIDTSIDYLFLRMDIQQSICGIGSEPFEYYRECIQMLWSLTGLTNQYVFIRGMNDKPSEQTNILHTANCGIFQISPNQTQIQYICSPTFKASRYILIANERNEEIIICELEVFTNNLALGKLAISSSSNNKIHTPGYAVHEPKLDNCFFSKLESMSWFSIDLAAEYFVYGIDLHSSEALFISDMLDVTITNDPPFIQIPTSMIQCERINDMLEFDLFITFLCPSKDIFGQFLFIRQSTFRLVICDIEVWGKFYRSSPFQDVGYKKWAWLSSYDTFSNFTGRLFDFTPTGDHPTLYRIASKSDAVEYKTLGGHVGNEPSFESKHTSERNCFTYSFNIHGELEKNSFSFFACSPSKPSGRFVLLSILTDNEPIEFVVSKIIVYSNIMDNFNERYRYLKPSFIEYELLDPSVEVKHQYRYPPVRLYDKNPDSILVQAAYLIPLVKEDYAILYPIIENSNKEGENLICSFYRMNLNFVNKNPIMFKCPNQTYGNSITLRKKPYNEKFVLCDIAAFGSLAPNQNIASNYLLLRDLDCFQNDIVAYDNMDYDTFFYKGKRIMMIFGNEVNVLLSKYLDKVNSLCGSASTQQVHIRECVEYIWEKYLNCNKNAKGLLDNLDTWMTSSLTLEALRNLMKVYSVNAFHYSESSSYISDKFKRYYCYGPDSSGKYNIALGKTVYYETNLSIEDNYHPNHLVDGVEFSNPELGGCSRITTLSTQSIAWVSIDMAEMYLFRKVVLYPAENGLTQNLNIVFGRYSPSYANMLSTPNTKTCARDIILVGDGSIVEVACSQEIVHTRYVSLFTFEASLMLCEVKVFTNNIALKGEAFAANAQSIDHYASFAVRENTDQLFFQTHTNVWFTVFLRACYLVYGIDLFKATFPTDIDVSVTNKSYAETTHANTQFCHSTSHKNDENVYLLCLHKSIGQFILIRGETLLKFQRIEAWGVLKAETGDYKNVASKKPSWSSLNFLDDVEKSHNYYATDGEDGKNLMMTKVDDYPWFYIDLIEFYTIWAIVIVKRALVG
ncbi:DgyrCDS8120, partial [Dimorphilus gyrociliatus]